MANLLVTKLRIPYARTIYVSRPRLAALLNHGLTKQLTLISAPAGYGKTTLLSEWLAHCAYPFGWISLDRGDNDPVRFWTYILAGLQGVFPSFGGSLAEGLTHLSQPPGEPFITELINGLDRLRAPVILILDDYHCIEAQAIHAGVTFLLEHAPGHFHLFISTRADPPLPLAKLRARSNLLELRRADLVFTAKEAADFLNHSMGLPVSSEDAARIAARTEGWIAGLQMAALSLQNTEDISGFIDTLTGSHQYIFDYLLEEILGRQTQEMRRFLLCTSIPDKLTASLGDALLDGDPEFAPMRPAAVLLEELERANLFIFSLDHERHWYRFHSLFADLLRGYLQRTHPNLIPSLHTRASIWFEDQGAIPDAIHHALAAQDWERVLRLLSANVFALLEQNELLSVARQLDHVAAEDGRGHIWLWIGRAWLAAYTGQLSAVNDLLTQIEAEVAGIGNEATRQALRGHTAAIQAYANWVRGQPELAARAAREALECLPANDFLLRCQSATMLGLAQKNVNERARSYEQALSYARAAGVSHISLFAYGCWAFQLIQQGMLAKAQTACLEGLRFAQINQTRQAVPALSHILAALSLVLYEWDDLENSLRHVRDAVTQARRWQQADALHFTCTTLGNVLFANGDAPGAFSVLEEARQVARRTSHWFEEITLNQEVEWRLAQGDTQAAERCLRQAGIDFYDRTRTFYLPELRLTIAWLLSAQDRYSEALEIVTREAAKYEAQDDVNLLLKALIQQADIYQKLGQEPQALAVVKKALQLGEPGGYMRTFTCAGSWLLPLLRQARAGGAAPEYVSRLIASPRWAETDRPAESAANASLEEPLSEREMDVLQQLAQGLPDKKIAESLVVARETVHKHLKNIYGKLGVHSRAEAVLRARELGLL